MSKREFDKISADAKLFLAKMQENVYLHMIGENLNTSLAEIYSNFPGLFSTDTIERLISLIPEDVIMKRRFKYLTEFISVEFVNKTMLPFRQEILDIRAQKIILPDGNQLSYNELKQKCFWEARKEKGIQEEYLKDFTESRLNKLIWESFDGEINAIQSLGYKSHIEMFKTLTGIDPAFWSNKAGKFLADTSELYFKKLHDFKDGTFGGKNIEISRDEFFMELWIHSDDDRFKTVSPAEMFNRLILRIRAFVPVNGIKLQSADRVSRAFCSILNAPNDIRLMIGEGRGFHQICDMLHEAGHALHYVNAESSLPFEFLRLGDESLTEGYAALFENLIYDGSWLKSEFGINKIQKSELISFLKFYKLTKLRSIAVKAVYENDLYSGLTEEVLRLRYFTYYRQHLGVDVNEYEFLAETEPFLFSLRYFRAQMLASNLRCKLETSFGSKWFEKSEAFKELLGLWKSGQQYSPEEISESYCGKGLIEADLTSEFK